jgi:hypothetical protein
VPLNVTTDGLEIRVTFPGGPLSGEIIGLMPLPVKPPKK